MSHSGIQNNEIWKKTFCTILLYTQWTKNGKIIRHIFFSCVFIRQFHFIKLKPLLLFLKKQYTSCFINWNIFFSFVTASVFIYHITYKKHKWEREIWLLLKEKKNLFFTISTTSKIFYMPTICFLCFSTWIRASKFGRQPTKFEAEMIYMLRFRL